MAKHSKKNLWFKAKNYGWGWMPVTWQGWLITIIYTLLLLWFSVLALVFPIFYLLMLLLTLFLIYICVKKGEQPSWRWGGKEIHINIQSEKK